MNKRLQTFEQTRECRECGKLHTRQYPDWVYSETQNDFTGLPNRRRPVPLCSKDCAEKYAAASAAGVKTYTCLACLAIFRAGDNPKFPTCSPDCAEVFADRADAAAAAGLWTPSQVEIAGAGAISIAKKELAAKRARMLSIVSLNEEQVQGDLITYKTKKLRKKRVKKTAQEKENAAVQKKKDIETRRENRKNFLQAFGLE